MLPSAHSIDSLQPKISELMQAYDYSYNNCSDTKYTGIKELIIHLIVYRFIIRLRGLKKKMEYFFYPQPVVFFVYVIDTRGSIVQIILWWACYRQQVSFSFCILGLNLYYGYHGYPDGLNSLTN